MMTRQAAFGWLVCWVLLGAVAQCLWWLPSPDNGRRGEPPPDPDLNPPPEGDSSPLLEPEVVRAIERSRSLTPSAGSVRTA